jgi:hypothetical protein
MNFSYQSNIDITNSQYNNESTDNNNVKKIFIIEEPKNTKKINCEKEKKMRVETKTWGLNEEQLSHQAQLDILKIIFDELLEKDKYVSMITSHIKTKISNYRQQDVFKKKLDEKSLVKFEEVVDLLDKCNMKCVYCSQEVYILYERVREMKQWTLDRINNDIGHNSGNLLIACLECNLKRRRTNKDAFMFTKNMVIVKES